MSDGDVVTAQSGKGLAYEWAKRQGLAENIWHNQRKRFSKLLTDRCVAEAVRVGELEWEFWERLNKVGEILEGIKNACAFPIVLRYWRVDDAPQAEKAAYAEADAVIWNRHDVTSVYELGYEQSRYPGVDRKALAHAAAEYLERPWLRLASLDWLIVNALVTDEIIQYGDSLKKTHIPGPSDWIERSAFETKTKGNVKAMEKEGRKYRKRPVLTFIGYQFVFPLVTIGTSIYFQAWKTMFAFIVLTLIDYALVVLRLLFWGFRRMRATPEQLRTPKMNDYRRFDQMRQVHRLLEGPVINPKVLREEMVKTTDGGAVWDSTAWAIVDRAISIDPNVWVTTFPSTD